MKAVDFHSRAAGAKTQQREMLHSRVGKRGEVRVEKRKRQRAGEGEGGVTDTAREEGQEEVRRGDKEGRSQQEEDGRGAESDVSAASGGGGEEK